MIKFGKAKEFVKVHEKKYCDVCSKAFKSEETYNDHLKSKKHVERLNGERTEKKKHDEGFKLKTTLDSMNVCVFCNEEAEDFEQQVNKKC